MNAPTIAHGVPSLSLAPGIAAKLLLLSKQRGLARYWQKQADALALGDSCIETMLRLAQLHREAADALHAELSPPTFKRVPQSLAINGALSRHFK